MDTGSTNTTVVREWTETVTPAVLMQQALDILTVNGEVSEVEVHRAQVLVTAAREMRIAKVKRSQEYSSVELSYQEVPEPAAAEPVGTHTHHLPGEDTPGTTQ